MHEGGADGVGTIGGDNAGDDGPGVAVLGTDGSGGLVHVVVKEEVRVCVPELFVDGGFDSIHSGAYGIYEAVVAGDIGKSQGHVQGVVEDGICLNRWLARNPRIMSFGSGTKTSLPQRYVHPCLIAASRWCC